MPSSPFSVNNTAPHHQGNFQPPAQQNRLRPDGDGEHVEYVFADGSRVILIPKGVDNDTAFQQLLFEHKRSVAQIKQMDNGDTQVLYLANQDLVPAASIFNTVAEAPDEYEKFYNVLGMLAHYLNDTINLTGYYPEIALHTVSVNPSSGSIELIPPYATRKAPSQDPADIANSINPITIQLLEKSLDGASERDKPLLESAIGKLR